MNKKIIITILCFGITSTSCAALNNLTIHSRANCINNESIAWDGMHAWTLMTLSQHSDDKRKDSKHGYNHVINTPWETTRRSAAVHWGEGNGSGSWTVRGIHYIAPNDRFDLARELGRETVTDCSIYDGWWDFKDDKNSLKQSEPGSFAARALLKIKPKNSLKTTFSDIKLSFFYKPIPIKDNKIIGYTVGGIDSKNGWSGIKTFFEYDNSICAFLYFRLNDSGNDPATKVDRFVNGKVTLLTSEGNNDSGFLYSVTWLDNVSMQILECANHNSDKTMIEKLIKLAKKIDRN